ncbi:double-strand break repair helicase AddA [Qipengyuania sediminis]|uniref:double-strand break repair helicase AddA n=1 Tax=Qipengyuania sediminis TaxID=1532023 RepID=UPI0010599CB6|nr:double-strand break repair helicase AddA [Qipengyuania sediminis]
MSGGKSFPLVGAQLGAVDPRDSVWLSASAGTGKTEVLSARVLRLLLEEGTEPGDILCLTFTKAGAAEMAVRVNARLASWVRMDDAALGRELAHVGASIDPATRDRARALFARVLDCPGGGLRIDTIHAFAQWLLGAFPGEAAILPGTRAIDDRERALLMDEVLTELIAGADAETLAAIEVMSLRHGPSGVRKWLMRCADAIELWEGPGGWQPPLRDRVTGLLGLASDVTLADCAALCGDDRFPMAALARAIAANRAWGTKTGLACAEVLERWRAGTADQRLADLDTFYGSLLTKEGAPKCLANLAKCDAEYEATVAEIAAGIEAAADLARLVALADFLTQQLAAGRRFALMWQAAKAREGLVDFDDLIRKAASLLQDRAMADWIRYKLDRRFDHILIDEAQDTNRAQWQIIDALTEEFFAGAGASNAQVRTIFTVGDTKQAIFGFQGTSPRNFLAARDRVDERMRGLVEASRSLRAKSQPRDLQTLDLDRSFRTAAPVLEFVDRAIAAIGYAQLGLDRPPPPHIGQDRPGVVGLWDLVIDGTSEPGEDEEEGEAAGWLARHDRMLADCIARQVKCWFDDGFPLVKNSARRAGPGDVMVLVRKRRELAALIVARLYAHGVPVAGVDRLRLGAPLAVQDLVAALRFAVQPLDDLTLASLLVSPLIGWSQEELLAHGYRPPGRRLWHHLREAKDATVAATVETLRAIMRRADYDSPQALLHWMLTGPMDGRRRLVARLGREANDPIDELLNAANAYASAHTASLQGFLRWFDAGANDPGAELKREADAGAGQVRVMTVHGSKGLQAPIVILADTAIAPDTPDELELAEVVLGRETGRRVPIPPLRKAERAGMLASAHAGATAELMEEHWRLLYVAMTRAEEALFIAGSLGPKQAGKGEAPPDSWYAKLRPLFEAKPLPSEIWGQERRWGALAPLPAAAPGAEASAVALPDWALQPAPVQPRLPRPLAPSGLGEADGADPPLPPEVTAAAARRGQLIHALLERLPQVPQGDRTARAAAWLARQAPELPDEDRAEIATRALGVLAAPEFAALFGPGSLAEVPLAALVGGQVIAGTADRLLVTAEAVTVCDFKTARRPPSTPGEVPPATLRQMAAYVAALEAIYPGRAVRAVVLYTQAPRLIALPPDVMEACKARFDAAEESFPLPQVD